MKKILYILSIMALVGCMNEETFIVDNPVTDSYGSFSSPLEISVGDSQTKSFDENLKWSWEESDKIYGYQVAGGKSVNTLTFVEDNRFGTPEFAYASEDAATFHFVYAGDATLDEAAEGNRGIRQDSRQSGEWRPVLVGSAVGRTISEVMNDEVEINMEHLSATLEVRLWKEGVDKNNLTDADKKNIVYAELMSDTENFLLDIVPISNQDGTVSYTDREKGEGEEDGGYIRTEYVNSPVAVFNIAPHAENYQAGALRLAIADENGDRYLLDVPALNFVAGQRTILNVEWKTPTSAYLPDGPTFNSAVDAFMTGKGITEIKFITNSATTSEDALVDGSIYLVQNGQTLEIHTAAGQFMANSNCINMFAGESYDDNLSKYVDRTFKQIQTIDFGDNFNTQNVTNMTGMFYECTSLTSLDVSNFDTQNVTNMGWMFDSCTSLISLDVSNFNTQNVTYMYQMFCSCSSLTSLDVSNFETQNVTNMRSMFYNCSSLTSLDVSNFDTQNVTNMYCMFSSCSSLTSLDLSSFNTQDVTSMFSMFSYCSSLTLLDVSNFDTQKVTVMYGMFRNCTSLTSLNVSNFNTQNVTNMSWMFCGCSSLTSLDVRNFDTKNVTSMGGMFYNCSNLTSLDVSNFDTQNVIYMTNMFGGCSSLTSLDVSNFNTQNVKYMYMMFEECSSLTLLDVSNFDTQNVTDMESMFYNCSNLTSLDLSSFSILNSPLITNMFYNTGSNSQNKPINIYVTPNTKSYIEWIDSDENDNNNSNIDNNYATLVVIDEDECLEYVLLPTGPEFNTIVDEYISKTSGITKIKFIAKSNIKSSNQLTHNIYLIQNGETLEIHTAASQFMANSNCNRMFYAYDGWDNSTTQAILNSFGQILVIDFGDNFNTQNVTEMVQMFYNCSSLTSLDLSNFNTQNVTTMFCMFMDCSSLTSLDLSNFDTQNVTDMSVMFSNCSSLTSLDVSNFDTQNVTEMVQMFYNCSSLTSLDVSNFNTQNVTTMYGMFQYCTSLTSLDLSKFTFESNPDIEHMFSSTGSNATNRPIPIYVSAEGKNYIQTIGDSYIGIYNATLTIKGTEYPSGIGYLPSGPIFYTYVNAFMTGKGITEIKFITNSATTSEDALVDGSIYLLQNGKTLEIHTSASQYTANASCNIMFSGYDGNQYNSFGQIQTIDFGDNFNTQNVTSMSYMFSSCTSLTSLDLSNFDTQNVTNMSGMFSSCTSLTSLDLSNFNTQNVTNMGWMFSSCSSLTSLDLGNFDTQNVTDMGCMFSSCTSLTSLDLSNFGTQNVTSMINMFYHCTSLTSLDVSNFDTQNVTSMGGMFSSCTSLTSLDVSNFVTQNVTRMDYVFYGCSSLTSLDLSNFTFESNPNIGAMFSSTGSNATNKPIPIYVSAEGKDYIETKGDTSINSNYAILTIKAPQGE